MTALDDVRAALRRHAAWCLALAMRTDSAALRQALRSRHRALLRAAIQVGLGA